MAEIKTIFISSFLMKASIKQKDYECWAEIETKIIMNPGLHPAS